jgi:hypothetical protein
MPRKQRLQGVCDHLFMKPHSAALSFDAMRGSRQ